MTVVGIDLGASGSRIATADGASSATGPAFAVTAGRAEHSTVVRTLIRNISPVGGPVAAVAVSAAGLVALGDPEPIRASIAEAWPDAVVVIASDAVAAVAGAWGMDGGAVVAAGTGVVAFGTDFAEVWMRSDGWGHVLGDDGGAAWVGARGIAAGLRAFDGRPNGSAALLKALRERHGDPLALSETVRAAANPATLLASFAPLVTREGRQGDDVARSIVEAAGRELADTGLSVGTRKLPQRLALVGGLADEPMIAEAFARRVRERRPELTVSIGSGTPLAGALLLAEQALGNNPATHPPYIIRFPSTSSPNLRGAS